MTGSWRGRIVVFSYDDGWVTVWHGAAHETLALNARARNIGSICAKARAPDANQLNGCCKHAWRAAEMQSETREIGRF
jgi:hypothetical protein